MSFKDGQLKSQICPGQKQVPSSIADTKMSSLFYHALKTIGTPFRYHCIGGENIAMEVPAIAIANHQGALGPIACVLSLPRRVFPWIIIDMLDPKRIGDQINKDFVRPAMRMSGKTGKLMAAMIAKIVMPMLQNINCIPVDRNIFSYRDLFKKSMDILLRGDILLILPEDPDSALDPQTAMRTFLPGFLWLCLIYKQKTGEDLPIYPIAVCPKTRKILVGKPTYYLNNERSKKALLEHSQILEEKIKRMLLIDLHCSFSE